MRVALHRFINSHVKHHELHRNFDIDKVNQLADTIIPNLILEKLAGVGAKHVGIAEDVTEIFSEGGLLTALGSLYVSIFVLCE